MRWNFISFQLPSAVVSVLCGNNTIHELDRDLTKIAKFYVYETANNTRRVVEDLEIFS